MNKNKSKVNFLLYGESTFLNKGCEAIVNTTIKKIRDVANGNITLATFDLENDSKRYNDIITKYIKENYEYEELSKEEQEQIDHFNEISADYDYIEKIKAKDLIEEIENADICMSIGGDNYCYGIPNWVYNVNKQCKLKGKKTVLWSTSIEEEITSDEMIRDLRTYDLITVRETLTYNALKKIMGEEHLMLVPDTAFSLKTKITDLPNIFKQNKEVIGLNISPLVLNYTQDQEKVFDSIHSLIKHILNKTDKNICLIPHVYKDDSNDLDALKKIKLQFKDEGRIELLDDRIYDCEELKYIISKCAILIAARTHASIAAYSTCVPTLVIGYSTKSKGIALDLFGNYKDYVIPVDEISPETLLQKYDFIEENKQSIIHTLENKIPHYIEDASNMMKNTLTKLEELDKKYITHPSMCTGCMACYNSCPNNAIELYENEEGFIMTKINPEKCIRCNLCKKACPINQNYKNKNVTPKVHAVKNNNEKERTESSSGGVFTLLASNIIERGGVVYGAQMENSYVHHIRIDNKKDIKKAMGAKYVQSRLDNSFQNVKQDLLTKKEVLFSGTPCQIEGLKGYLSDIDQEKLLCVSLICHGVPSQKVLKQYTNEIDTIESFRNKEDGWHTYKVQYKSGNRIDFDKDDYMKGFLKNYFLRESCYNCQCKYYDKNRADIILGDFWGIENVLPGIDDDKGVSAIIINSSKGEDAFNSISSNCTFKEVEFDEIEKYNPYAIKSVKYTKKRAEFYELIKNNQIKTSIAYLSEKELVQEKKEIEKILRKFETDNTELKQYIKDLEEAKEYFITQIDIKDNQIKDLKAKEESSNAKLEKIYNSKIWRCKNKIDKIIKRKK